jgi:hypothetical protein
VAHGMDDATSDDVAGRWMTYAELARLRGVDKPSALKLALRKRWPRRKDNHGTMQVCVPPDWARPWGDGTALDIPPAVQGDMDVSRAISALEAANTALQEQLARESSRADQLQHQVVRAEARADRAEQKADAADARANRAEQSRDADRSRVDALRDRVDVLQGELATAEAAVEQTRAGAQAVEEATAVVRQTDDVRRQLGIWPLLRRAWRGK